VEAAHDGERREQDRDATGGDEQPGHDGPRGQVGQLDAAHVRASLALSIRPLVSIRGFVP